MRSPDIPEDEEERLEALRSLDILDTPDEESFDRLTRLARRMFGVPIALVSVVDKNRQWFKSRAGLDATETPRDISFCGHAILGDDVFVIPDTTADERFHDNPLVLDDPHIRFYAGCPLKTRNGHTMGTLCIIDREPRNLDADDLEALRDLASTVEREFAAMELASNDELTNISNRRGFMVLAQRELSLCTRQHIPASLVFFDLNDFKTINDGFGHAEGDKVLITFAEKMSSIFRGSDHFARLGGDEFVVLLPNTSKSHAENAVERFRKLLDNYNQESGCGYSVSFSYGIVDFDPDEHPTIEALLVDGDALMYEHKKSGRR